jgi:hypothetical protein
MLYTGAGTARHRSQSLEHVAQLRATEFHSRPDTKWRRMGRKFRDQVQHRSHAFEDRSGVLNYLRDLEKIDLVCLSWADLVAAISEARAHFNRWFCRSENRFASVEARRLRWKSI